MYIMKALEKTGPLEKRLTHMPFTHAFTGSNPVRVTNRKLRQFIVELSFLLVFELLAISYLVLCLKNIKKLWFYLIRMV